MLEAGKKMIYLGDGRHPIGTCFKCGHKVKIVKRMINLGHGDYYECVDDRGIAQVLHITTLVPLKELEPMENASLFAKL